MKIIEIRSKEMGFVLWGHCQNFLDDPRIGIFNSLETDIKLGEEIIQKMNYLQMTQSSRTCCLK